MFNKFETKDIIKMDLVLENGMVIHVPSQNISNIKINLNGKVAKEGLETESIEIGIKKLSERSLRKTFCPNNPNTMPSNIELLQNNIALIRVFYKNNKSVSLLPTWSNINPNTNLYQYSHIEQDRLFISINKNNLSEELISTENELESFARLIQEVYKEYLNS